MDQSCHEGNAKSINRVVRNAILKLCRTNAPYLGDLEVDGIICISGSRESEQIVVKVHEKLYKSNKPDNDAEDIEKPDTPDNYTSIGSIATTQSTEKSREKGDNRRSNKLLDSERSSPQTAISIKTEHDRIELDDSPSDVNSIGFNNSGLSDSYNSVNSPLSSPYASVSNRPPYFISQLPVVPECKQCGFTFAQIELLQEHNEAVHGVYTCRFCYRTFTSRSNLDRHLRLHTGQKPYSCKKCGKSFSRKDHLSNHAAKHAFKCGQCHKRYGDRQQLDTHYNMDHHTPLIALCVLCNKGFHDSVAYAEHQKAHPGSKGNKFPSTALDVPFTCPVCSFKTSLHLDLLKHKQIHNPNHTSYRCLSCLRVFSDPVLYSDHFDDHREETNVFECCVCRQTQNTYSRLRTHEKEHLGGRHSYSLCSPGLSEYPGGLLSTGMYGADRHGWMNNGDEASCVCPYCSLSLASSTAMLEHIAQQHQFSADRKILDDKLDDCSSSDEQEDACTPSPNAPRDSETPSHADISSDMLDEQENKAPSKMDIYVTNKGIVVEKTSRANSPSMDSTGSEIIYIEPSGVDSPQNLSAPVSPRPLTPMTVGRVEMKRSHSPDDQSIRSRKLVTSLMPKKSRRAPAHEPVRKINYELPSRARDEDKVTNNKHEESGSFAPEDMSREKPAEIMKIKSELNEHDDASQSAVDYMSLAHNHGLLYNLPTSYNPLTSPMSVGLLSGMSPVLPPGALQGSLTGSLPPSSFSSALTSNLPPSLGSSINVSGSSLGAPAGGSGSLGSGGGLLGGVKGDMASILGGVKGDMASILGGVKGDMASILGGVKGDMSSILMSADHNGFMTEESTSQSRPGSSDSMNPSGGSEYLPLADPEDRAANDLPPLSSSPTPPSLYTNNFDPVALDGSSIRTSFMCDVCGHRMDGFDVYAKHCFLAHLRYPCVYCSKTFAQKANRERHMCIHTGSRPYQCRQCGERFSRGDKLKHHRLKYHQASASEVTK